MSIKFDYNDNSKTLIVTDDTKTNVYRIDDSKYGQIFRHMIKSIDELDSKEPSGVMTKALNFCDYDGTIVASYAENEIDGLTSLPKAPSHDGLTFDEWNWTLEAIKSYHTHYPMADIWVGATYHTTDGKNHIFFDVPHGEWWPVVFYSSDPGTVDWGDGSEVESFEGGEVSHTYAEPGKYDCKVEVDGINSIGVAALGEREDFIKNIGALMTTELRLSSNVTNLDYHLIYENSNLSKVMIPNSVTSISYDESGNNYVRIDDNNLITCLVIPSSLTYSEQRFISSSTLEILCLPYTFNKFNYRSITADKITSITIPENVTEIGQGGFSFENVEKLIIPNGITNLDAIIRMPPRLKYLYLPDSITTIGDFLVRTHCLKTVRIPNNVTAFTGAMAVAIHTVIFESDTPATNWYVICDNSEYIYVPYSEDHSVLEAYKATLKTDVDWQKHIYDHLVESEPVINA